MQPRLSATTAVVSILLLLLVVCVCPSVGVKALKAGTREGLAREAKPAFENGLDIVLNKFRYALFWDELKYFKHLAGKVQSKGTQDYPLIIGANLGKTGTSTLAAAARQMKFRAYHWQLTAFQSMKSTEAWEELKEKGVMLVDDFPTYQYVPELASVYPSSRIVLTARSGEAWLDSARRHAMRRERDSDGYGTKVSPRAALAHWSRISLAGMIAANAVPEGRGIVWALTDNPGWQPLCSIMPNTTCPTKPFPAANVFSSGVAKSVNPGRVENRTAVPSQYYSPFDPVIPYFEDSAPWSSSDLVIITGTTPMLLGDSRDRVVSEVVSQLPGSPSVYLWSDRYAGAVGKYQKACNGGGRWKKPRDTSTDPVFDSRVYGNELAVVYRPIFSGSREWFYDTLGAYPQARVILVARQLDDVVAEVAKARKAAGQGLPDGWANRQSVLANSKRELTEKQITAMTTPPDQLLVIDPVKQRDLEWKALVADHLQGHGLTDT